MKNILVILMVFTLFDKWDIWDSLLLVTAMGATYVDERSTERVINHDGFERNPALGKYPSNSKIRTWFILSELGIVVTAGILPPTWRKVFLLSIGVMEIRFCYINDNLI